MNPIELVKGNVGLIDGLFKSKKFAIVGVLVTFTLIVASENIANPMVFISSISSATIAVVAYVLAQGIAEACAALALRGIPASPPKPVKEPSNTLLPPGA